ncbi:unnamed protein product [Phaeothamnion confervicola]
MHVSIPTYVINLKDRIDRKNHILREFESRNEFDVKIVEAKQHESGSIGLWNSIRYIIDELISVNQEYILICEDDHQFTKHYSKAHLFGAINAAIEQQAGVLLGGVSWLSSIFSLRDSIYWVESFNGTQFMILFRQSFEKILRAEFTNKDNADLKISELISSKFLIYPFISTQKGFGYSDITARNADIGSLAQLFIEAEASVKYMLDGERFYKSLISKTEDEEDHHAYDETSIRTFLIHSNTAENNEFSCSRLFEEKNEFNTKVMTYDKSRCNLHRDISTLRRIINLSIEEDNDVIIYCSSKRVFSEEYNRNTFIKCIIDAYGMGADLIYGADGGHFNHAVPLSKQLLWVDHYTSLEFTIIFRSLFFSILHETTDDRESLEDFISRLSTNKLLLFPSIFHLPGNNVSTSRLWTIQDNFSKSIQN